jgi:hypothetical protein
LQLFAPLGRFQAHKKLQLSLIPLNFVRLVTPNGPLGKPMYHLLNGSQSRAVGASLISASRPIAVHLRDSFLLAVAELLRGIPDPGDGDVPRAIRQAQKRLGIRRSTSPGPVGTARTISV